MATRRRTAPVTVAEEKVAEPISIGSLRELRAVLEADDRPIESVRVPEWTGAPVFHLRGLTGHDRDVIENTTFGEGINDISAKIVARALVTPEGTRLARSAEELREAERMLTSATAGGLLRLQRVAKRLSKLDTAAIEELEQLLKDDPSGKPGSD